MKTPLRTVLKNFLNHVEDLEARKEISNDQYEIEFQELKKLTDKLKEDPEYSSTCGLKDVNRPKNRYKDIVPYDISRVVLPKYDGIPGSDYINASHVKGSSGAFAYIAAQGPLPNTVIDFWRMIWLCDVQVIVMACNEQEAGKHKCESYWPIKGEINHFGNISVELINTSQVCPDFLVRTLLVKCDSEMRDVYQFHYTTWPDHGVPDAVHPILELVRLMRDCQASETVPILVHCSAGCGRTGTICAVDYVWACLRHGKLDKDFSLFHIALELRRQRIAMIQTKEQYILAHRAVASMFEQQLKVIDFHIYENIDEDGEPLMWKELQEDSNLCTVIKKTDENGTDNYSNNRTSLSSQNDKEKKTETPDKRQSNCSEQSIQVGNSKVISVCESSSTLNSLHNEINYRNSIVSSKNSEGSFSRNSYLSQQSNNDDAIPFIDEEEEISFRPQCGRAYLNIPSCDSITKLINAFDPFVDKLSLGTDDSSPEGEGLPINSQLRTNVSSVSNSLSERAFDKLDESQTAAGNEMVASYKKIDPDAELCQKDPQARSDDGVENKNDKKVCKATVVRRPSISKLKALFERPSSSGDKSSVGEAKRSLFRHHTHHVSRAGSAPPSLNCMDKNAATEKESILMMVTRKFRSSSVKSEQELNAKQNAQSKKPVKSPMTAFKESINSLSRTMSLNLNKTFKTQSPRSDTKPENGENQHETNCVTFSTPKENVHVGGRFKLPDISPKGKSMWYDKSSLPRAIGIVKPSGKKTEDVSGAPKPSVKGQSSIFHVIDKPPKLLPFLTGLGKNEGKDSSSMWYENNTCPKDNATTEKGAKQNTPHVNTNISKILPFISTNAIQKKNENRSLSEGDSQSKEGTEAKCTSPTSNSKFYTKVSSSSLPPNLPLKKRTPEDVPPCPIPDEIIPISSVLNKKSQNSFWPSSSLAISEEGHKEPSSSNLTESRAVPCEGESYIEHALLSPTVGDGSNSEKSGNKSSTHPPAIPKKIGKSKGSESQFIENLNLKACESGPPTADKKCERELESKPSEKQANAEDKVVSSPNDLNDLYSNVNVAAKKNIEQIEHTLRNNPRGAIIDLTSRQSYSMEEELVNAVEQLPTKKPIAKSATLETKPVRGKFPGYEVIWPESDYDKLKTSNSSLNSVKNQLKTGLCYSPPLRRNVNANFPVTKSQSCVNLDWMDTGKDNQMNESSFEKNSEPTKKLVNEAVVELNTLLNQLTTRTLAEHSDSNGNAAPAKLVHSASQSSNRNESTTQSIPMCTKSFISVATSKDEEIIFRFPPPPPLPPPPEEDAMSESFKIICKNGAVSVDNANDSSSSVADASVHGEPTLNLKPTDSTLANTTSRQSPKPLPRKTKQTLGIQRSISYTSIPQSDVKSQQYENVFPEKYQTLSQTEVNNNKLESEHKNLHIDFSLKSSKEQSVDYKAKYSTPKEKTANSKHTEKPRYANVSKNIFPSFGSKSSTDSIQNSLSAAINLSEMKKIDTAVELRVKASNLHAEDNKNKDSSKPCEFPGWNKSTKDVRNEGLDVSNCTKNNTAHACNEEQKPQKKFIVCNDSSNYGKLIKVTETTTSTNVTKDQLLAESEHISQSENSKRKPLPSKKSERAPLPPTSKHFEIDEGGYGRLTTKTEPSPKKPPSRKQEKAPAPPPLHSLLNTPSSTSVSLTKVEQSQYANIPALVASSKKLPALYENISDMQNSTKQIAQSADILSQPSQGHGLNHSQSDASVFRSIKERRMQYQGIPVKTFVKPKPLNNKPKEFSDDPTSTSSNDSDHSYEHIFPSRAASNVTVNPLRQEDSLKITSVNNSKESSVLPSSQNDASEPAMPSLPGQQPIVHLPKENFKKTTPTAPPRSRRRSTTEVNYAKVKSKAGSLTTSNAAIFKQFGQKTKLSSNGDDPPTIPIKTKDAFEVAEEFVKGQRPKSSNFRNSTASASHKATKSYQDFEVS